MVKNEIIEASITALNHEGGGVSRINNSTVSVPRALPGDSVKIKIMHAKGNYAKGEIIKIIKPSGKRVKPGCRDFEKDCGGCQWLHLEYGEQLQWKTKIMEETLKNQSKTDIKVNSIIGMEDPYQCRNKLSLLNIRGRLMFMQENTTRTILLDNCPQEIEANRKIYNILKTYDFPEVVLQVHIRSSLEGKTGICFFVKRFQPEINRISAQLIKNIKNIEGIAASSYREYHTVAGRDYIEQKIGNYLYRIPLNGFFQTNYLQSGTLLKLVSDALGPENGNILDLYCGSGFFTLPAAAKAKKALGIDNNPGAVKSARVNAGINGVRNAEFIISGIRQALKDMRTGLFQTVILDPPRSGCEPEVIREILRIKPRNILYVSCSPETLARDLRLLTEKNYKAVYCQPVDMFPHTFHIETLVKLELK